MKSKKKQMRTSKPARQRARPAEVDLSIWQRLAQFPERYRENCREARAKWEKEQKEHAAETWEQSIRRHIRELRAALRNPPEPSGSSHTKRFWAWFHDRGRAGARAFVSSSDVLELVEISKGDLMRATSGAAFRLDFGRDDIIFLKVDFEKWIRAQARQAKAVAALRPALRMHDRIAA